jgi:hypothetical protein
MEEVEVFLSRWHENSKDLIKDQEIHNDLKFNNTDEYVSYVRTDAFKNHLAFSSSINAGKLFKKIITSLFETGQIERNDLYSVNNGLFFHSRFFTDAEYSMLVSSTEDIVKKKEPEGLQGPPISREDLRMSWRVEGSWASWPAVVDIYRDGERVLEEVVTRNHLPIFRCVECGLLFRTRRGSPERCSTRCRHKAGERRRYDQTMRNYKMK